jgi:hypothetical protein
MADIQGMDQPDKAQKAVLARDGWKLMPTAPNDSAR